MSENKQPNREHIPDLRSYAYHQKAAEILRAHPVRLTEIKQTLDGNNWSQSQNSK